jgi:hypothetical protein
MQSIDFSRSVGRIPKGRSCAWGFEPSESGPAQSVSELEQKERWFGTGETVRLQITAGGEESQEECPMSEPIRARASKLKPQGTRRSPV